MGRLGRRMPLGSPSPSVWSRVWREQASKGGGGLHTRACCALSEREGEPYTPSTFTGDDSPTRIVIGRMGKGKSDRPSFAYDAYSSLKSFIHHGNVHGRFYFFSLFFVFFLLMRDGALLGPLIAQKRILSPAFAGSGILWRPPPRLQRTSANIERSFGYCAEKEKSKKKKRGKGTRPFPCPRSPR